MVIRGVAAGSVEEMRKSLAMSRRLEKSGESFVYHIYFYKPEEDISAVQTKLDELDPLRSTFSDSTSSSDF